MPRETEHRVLKLIQVITKTRTDTIRTPDWMKRPGRHECQRHWPLVASIYRELAGMTLPEMMPEREWRQVDGILEIKGHAPRIVEIDEPQHFNAFRSATIRRYPRNFPVAFDQQQWARWGDRVRTLSGVGFGKPRPPLFPNPGGRHLQRAFRDVLCDLLPPLFGYAPTLRIAEWEVAGWIQGRTAKQRLSELLAERGVL
jgi:hypothetical protein